VKKLFALFVVALALASAASVMGCSKSETKTTSKTG